MFVIRHGRSSALRRGRQTASPSANALRATVLVPRLRVSFLVIVRAPPLFLCESGLGVAGGGLRPFRRRPA